MKYNSGGFLLVVPVERSQYMDDSIIPEKIVNPSDCICDIHPEYEALSWTNESKENRKAWRAKLGISEIQETDIHRVTDQWFNEEKIGWGFLFYELADALEYRQNWLGNLKGVVVLEIGTTDFYANELINEFKPKNKNEGELGIIHAIKRNQSMFTQSHTLGFDTFGFEYGGSFHSFICNSLEKDYKTKLGLSFTKHGFLTDFDSAVKAAEYNNDPNTGTEPVLWQPWIVNQVNCQPHA